MEEALSFFRAFEVWIYLLLGLGGLFYIRKFVLAWQELQSAGFGLERENAQARLNQSASALVLLLTMGVTEFVLVSFIAPTIPGATPLLTPTLDFLATPTTTLAPAATALAGMPVTPQATLAVTPLDMGCQPDALAISSPQSGQEVSGVVVISGTVNIPDFGFYMIKMKTPDAEQWATLEAGNQLRTNAQLGRWDTRRLSPGEYELGLWVTDNQGQSAEPCVVKLRVTTPPATAGP